MVQITIDKRDDIIVVCPIGELTALRNLDELSSTLDDYLEQNHKHYVFDMQEVSYLDSSGLGVFFGIYKKLSAAKATMAMARVPERLIRIFEIMKFQTLVKFCESVDEAIKVLRGSQDPS